MNLKRIMEIESSMDEAVRYFRKNYSRGPFWGNWSVNGTSEVPYSVNYYPDGTFDCSCPAYLYSPIDKKECKHTRVLSLMVRMGEVTVPEGHVCKPLTITNIHREILKWFRDNGIDNPSMAVTTRYLISRMRSRECLHADQTFRGRVSEAFKAGLLTIIEPVTDRDNAPPSAHYYITGKGKEVIG